VVYRTKRRDSTGGNDGVSLRTFAPNATGQLNVFGHDRDTLGVDGAQIGIFKEADQIGFGRFLQGQHGRALKAEIAFEILSNLTDQSLEGEFTDQQVSRLLVPTNLTQGDCARTVPVGFLDTTRGRGGFARRLGGELLARSFPSGAFTGAVICLFILV
jgi:hypothetical protein